MYALVLWKDDKPKTTSVLPLEDVKKEEEKVLAKWGENWYEVDLMLEDDDVEFLNDVPISTNGEFLSRKNINKTPEHLIAKKRKIKANNRLNNKMITKNMKKNNKQLFYPSIYSDTSDDEVKIDKKTHDDNKKVAGKAVETHEDIEKKTEKLNEESFHSSSSNSTVQSCAFCECLSTDLPYDEKILKIAEAAANSLSRLVEESGRRMPKSNEVRLHGDYDVMIGRRKLDDILRLNKNKPKNIIRELAKELIGEQKLATLSATAIDEDIVKAIEGCTNRYTNKSNRMSMTQVKRCITLYCGFCKTKLSAKTKLDSGLKSTSQENHTKEKPKIKSIKNHAAKVKIVPSKSTESKVLEDVYDHTQDLNKDMEIVEDEKNSDLKKSTLDAANRKPNISQEFMNEELASNTDDPEVSSREGSPSRSILEEIEKMKAMYSDKKLRKSEEKEREYEQDNVSQKHEDINDEINRNERKVDRNEREMRHESKTREHEREVERRDRKHESKQENNKMTKPNGPENKNDSKSKEKSEFRGERKNFEKKQEVREKSKKREHEREHELREHEREHELREHEREHERRKHEREHERREREKEYERKEREKESERREREKERDRKEREKERDRKEREKERDRKERERERERREREKERERREYLKYRELKKIRVSRDTVSRNRSISRKRDGDYKRRERYSSTEHKR